ncbi:F168B inhibitor, partial [Fregata magnificens]|nr:F168B inhibitor [Fregata magnificens]
EIMNPVYSPGSSGVPYANAKGIGYPEAAAPAYSPNMYPGANPTFQTGYTPGTPYKVSCSPTSGAVPPYSSSPNPYQTAVYPVRSAYPQQNPYAQVNEQNKKKARQNTAALQKWDARGVLGGIIKLFRLEGTSVGTLLTTHSPTPVAPHPVTMPTYRAPGTPTYSYVPPQW